VCPQCQSKEWAGGLFDALNDRANGILHRCPECRAEQELHLTFDFGLDAGPHPAKVLDAFLPTPIRIWPRDGGASVEFYPFLVMVESMDEGYTSAWLPYWHLVRQADGGLERKYGQWAQCLDLESYASLVSKARAKRYLT
jgi:hypothetical protein